MKKRAKKKGSIRTLKTADIYFLDSDAILEGAQKQYSDRYNDGEKLRNSSGFSDCITAF